MAQENQKQKQLITEVMQADEKDGLYQPTISKMETVQTPKEKANQLTDAFYQYLPLERYVTTSDGDLCWEYDGWENAKQCALIAVDEIIKVACDESAYDESVTKLYWLQVKQEIQKL